jgi:RIO kinase 1
VPFPVQQTEDGVLMEYVGSREGAAPRVANAHLTSAEAVSARDQLLDTLRALAGAHLVHGDLSVYNMLWWQSRLVVIDFPQAVDSFNNPFAPDLLYRDLQNVHTWFDRQRAGFEIEPLYVELIELLFNGPAADILKKPVRRL